MAVNGPNGWTMFIGTLRSASCWAMPSGGLSEEVPPVLSECATGITILGPVRAGTLYPTLPGPPTPCHAQPSHAQSSHAQLPCATGLQ